jgi:hypothetical protein
VLQSSAGAALQIIVRSKEQQQQQMGALLDSIRAVDGARVGTLPKEQHSGQLAELWGQQLADSGLATCDATAGALQDSCALMCFVWHQAAWAGRAAHAVWPALCNDWRRRAAWQPGASVYAQ